MIWVRDDLGSTFAGLAFDDFLRLGQELVRIGPDGARRTAWFERAGQRFYVKAHTGVGWREILKSWLQLKRAVVDALPEARALRRLEELGIPGARLAAHGVEGANPARRRSFVITESLENTEDLAEWLARQGPLAPGWRGALARALGGIAGRLHGARLAHQDLYLTHFRIRLAPGGGFELFLIDLHRALPARAGSRRWRLKDLAALRFSTLALPVSRSDCARFLRAYRARPKTSARNLQSAESSRRTPLRSDSCNAACEWRRAPGRAAWARRGRHDDARL